MNLTGQDLASILAALTAITPLPNAATRTAVTDSAGRVFWLDQTLFVVEPLQSMASEFVRERVTNLLRLTTNASVRLRGLYAATSGVGWVCWYEYCGSDFANFRGIIADHFRTLLVEMSRGQNLSPMPPLTINRTLSQIQINPNAR
jgi:hypothetical protein